MKENNVSQQLCSVKGGGEEEEKGTFCRRVIEPPTSHPFKLVLIIMFEEICTLSTQFGRTYLERYNKVTKSLPPTASHTAFLNIVMH